MSGKPFDREAEAARCYAIGLEAMRPAAMPATYYDRWRHGGWYVGAVRYPSGACGCVSNNYADGKWRIACDPRPFAEQPTFKTREAAARAEYALVRDMYPELGEVAA